MTDKIVVIFRKFNDNGDVIALFPEIPTGSHFDQCLSYMRLGQHAEADYTGVVQQSAPAEPGEYADLKRELELFYDYNLKIRSKISPKMRAARRAEVHAWRERRKSQKA